MADNISLINCPADCATDNVWPAIPAEQDCASYEQTRSQVSDLIIIPTGAADVFEDWAGDIPTPTYADGTIDNTVRSAINTAATTLWAEADPEMVIYSRPLGASAGQANRVTGALVPDKLSWLRSRPP